MKNLAIMACPCAHQAPRLGQQVPARQGPRGPRRWRDVDRLDNAARNGALDATDDDAIPKLQPALDDPQPAVDRVPGFDGALLDDILLVDQEQVAPLLAVAERTIGHEQGFDVALHRHPHAHEQPRQQRRILVVEQSPDRQRAVPWSRSGAMWSILPACGKPVSADPPRQGSPRSLIVRFWLRSCSRTAEPAAR
jgi:hypothetical protein